MKTPQDMIIELSGVQSSLDRLSEEVAQCAERVSQARQNAATLAATREAIESDLAQVALAGEGLTNDAKRTAAVKRAYRESPEWVAIRQQEADAQNALSREQARLVHAESRLANLKTALHCSRSAAEVLAAHLHYKAALARAQAAGAMQG